MAALRSKARSGRYVVRRTRSMHAGGGEGGAGRGNGCIKILKRKLAHHVLRLTVRVCGAGRLSARGRYLKGASRRLRKASTTTLKLKLSRAGVPVQEVNRLLNQFEQMREMMKRMQKGGLAKMMRGMKGFMPGMR